MGMSMAQGAFLYPPDAMNEFSVLSYVVVLVRLCPIHPLPLSQRFLGVVR